MIVEDNEHKSFFNSVYITLRKKIVNIEHNHNQFAKAIPYCICIATKAKSYFTMLKTSKYTKADLWGIWYDNIKKTHCNIPLQ